MNFDEVGNAAEDLNSITWTVQITKNKANGRPLLIPARIVKKNFRTRGKRTIVRYNGSDFPCKLLRYKRNSNEVLLSGWTWKFFCNIRDVTEGDVVNFKFEAGRIPILHVGIIYNEWL